MNILIINDDNWWADVVNIIIINIDKEKKDFLRHQQKKIHSLFHHHKNQSSFWLFSSVDEKQKREHVKVNETILTQLVPDNRNRIPCDLIRWEKSGPF